MYNAPGIDRISHPQDYLHFEHQTDDVSHSCLCDIPSGLHGYRRNATWIQTLSIFLHRHRWGSHAVTMCLRTLAESLTTTTEVACLLITLRAVFLDQHSLDNLTTVPIIHSFICIMNPSKPYSRGMSAETYYQYTFNPTRGWATPLTSLSSRQRRKSIRHRLTIRVNFQSVEILVIWEKNATTRIQSNILTMQPQLMPALTQYAAAAIGSSRQHVRWLQVHSGLWPRPFPYAPCLPVGESTYHPEVPLTTEPPSMTQNGALQHDDVWT